MDTSGARRLITTAWLIILGVVIYRAMKDTGGLPAPGQVIGITGVYAIMSLVGEVNAAAPLAVAFTALVTVSLALAQFRAASSGKTAKAAEAGGAPSIGTPAIGTETPYSSQIGG